MNDRLRNSSHFESDNDYCEEDTADAEVRIRQHHRTPRNDTNAENDGNNHENSFGSSSLASNDAYHSGETGNNDDENVGSDAEGVGLGGDNNVESRNNNKWSPDMKIDENFDTNNPIVVAGVAGVGRNVNDVAAGTQQQQLLSPRSQSQTSTTTFLTTSPRLTKYLCIASVFLVFCSLGLATAGLGLIYSTNHRNTNSENNSALANSNIGNDMTSSFDNADKEMTADITTLVGLDTKDDVKHDKDQTNAKARLTDEPTTSPTRVKMELIDDVSSISTTAATIAATAANGTTTQLAVQEVENNSTDTNLTSNATPVVLLVPDTLLSISLPAIADTFLEQSSTQAYGRVKRLKVDGQPARASLLKFNLSSIITENNVKPKDVVKYSLRLYSLASSPYGGKIDVLKRNCNSWNEANITWDNAPRCVFQNNSALVGVFDAEIPEFAWNEALMHMNDDVFEAQVITLRITSHYANGVMYASRENDTAIPELVVYYTSSSLSPSIDGAASTSSPAPSSSPEQEEIANSTSTMSPSATMTPSISPVPTFNPTQWPTFFPTASPVSNGTVSPTALPTTKPDNIIIPVVQDAMIRGGEFSNTRYGLDPFMALTGLERKALLQFDLSTADVRPNVEYEYTLQLYVSYVAANDQRSVTASCIAPQENYNWDEFDISWNSYGSPPVFKIGWFTIFLDDMESLVSIPLGSLSNCTSSSADSSKKIILVMEIEDSDGRGDKFDFRSREYGEVFQGMVDTPPVLIGVPFPQI